MGAKIIDQWPPPTLKERPLTASWLLGILITVIILAGGAWCTIVFKKVDNLEISDGIKSVKIGVIGTKQESQGTQLTRIENKLDKLNDKTK